VEGGGGKTQGKEKGVSQRGTQTKKGGSKERHLEKKKINTPAILGRDVGFVGVAKRIFLRGALRRGGEN